MGEAPPLSAHPCDLEIGADVPALSLWDTLGLGGLMDAGLSMGQEMTRRQHLTPGAVTPDLQVCMWGLSSPTGLAGLFFWVLLSAQTIFWLFP